MGARGIAHCRSSWKLPVSTVLEFQGHQCLITYDDFLGFVSEGKGTSLEDAVWPVPIAGQETDPNTHMAVSARDSLRFAFQELRSDRLDQNFQLSSDAQNYIDRLNLACFNRNAFITNKGFLGLGPSNMEAGDKGFIILSAQVPMILRDARDAKYRIFGEAYVDGIMVSNFRKNTSVVNSYDHW